MKAMEPTIEVSLTLSELKETVKSLSIGCDQIAKKIDRLGDSKQGDEVAKEYMLLMHSKLEFEEALMEVMA